MTALDDLGSLGPLAVEGLPGSNLQAATSTSVHGPSVTGERSRSFDVREFGLYASTTKFGPKASSRSNSSLKSTPNAPYSSARSRSTTHPRLATIVTKTTTTVTTKSPSLAPSTPGQQHHLAAAAAAAPVAHYYDPFYSPDETDWHAYSTNHRDGSFHHHHSRFSSSTNDTTSTTDYYTDSPTPSPPRSPTAPISPRWDSLAYNSAVVYSHHTHHAQSSPVIASTLADSPPAAPTTPTRKHFNVAVAALATELSDESPRPVPVLAPVRRANMMTGHEGRPVGGDGLPVGNFSRPRPPSIKHTSPDSVRARPGTSNTSQADPSYLDTLVNPTQYLRARDRGQSISSNQSASTFASLPVRPPPDLHYPDNFRGRSRQPHPPFARHPMAYGRAESTGHPFTRDMIPRMASMPSDELRSSYRSQLSTSTAPGTVRTERSSVLTKSSSVTSISMPVDEAFSVDDVMDIYEEGFRDDSPERQDGQEEQDDDSRPPTAKSERNRRRTALLDAFSDSLPMRRGDAATENEDADVFCDDEEAEPAAQENSTDDPAESRDSIVEAESPSEDCERNDPKHDSGKMVDDFEDDEIPKSPQQTQPALRISIENTDLTRDRYGFRKENQYVTQEQYDTWNESYSDYMDRRRRKWQAFMKESGLITDDPTRFPQRSAKTKRFVRKGIPPEWRGAAWFYYAGGPAILSKHGGIYKQLLAQKAKDIDKEAIERDLHRTFPDNIKFRAADTSSIPNTEYQESGSSQANGFDADGNPVRSDESDMISSLRRVLHAFSIYNPRIGYCQSLNFLAGLLLLFTETEEHAFWLLNIITRVYLPGTHETSLEGANVDLGVLMTSVQETMPNVWAKIGGELDGTDTVKPKSRRHRRNPTIPTRLPPVTLCMTAWFMSCFIGTLPIETTLRVWDVFFYEGSKTLFRIALTIFKLGENEIKSVGDPMEIFQVVQAMPRRLLNANALMEACFRRRNGFGHISQETIEERRLERRKNVKLEKERIATGLTEDGAAHQHKNNLFGKKRP